MDPAFRSRRTELIREAALLQIKLLADGFRDAVLIPVSLIAALIGLLRGGDNPDREFRRVIKLGRRSERWINLFGAASHLHGPPSDEDSFPVEDVDAMVSRVESYVVDEYRRGGVTAQAKERLDKALDLLHKKARRQKSGEDEA